jgi:hypothetical protein
MHKLDDQNERTHQRIWELLPWYANGTLAEAEREKVEAHLAVCARCRDEEEACRRMTTAAKAAGEVAPSPHPVQLQRMLARIDESEAEERSGAGWWRRVAPLRTLAEAAPGSLRVSLVAEAAVILLLVGLIVWQELRLRPASVSAPPAVYQTLSDPSPATVPSMGVRVMFSPQATEREIRDLLLGIRGQLVTGPSPLGVYTVEVPADGDPMKAVLARLRSEPLVAFAEPVNGGEGVQENHDP